MKRMNLWLVLTAAYAVSALYSHAQDWPRNGLYQIMLGRYSECCGIGGPFFHVLPDAHQAFVELTVDPDRKIAEMRILRPDMRTVFQTVHSIPESRFSFTLSNGMVFPDHIRFGQPMPPPQPFISYILSNSTDGLRINGAVTRPPVGADLPNEFAHSNVLAVLMPTAAIRVSEVEVCWSTVSNRSYQLQYRSSLATNGWRDLGGPVAGNGGTNCVADRVAAGEAGRFYRVLTR